MAEQISELQQRLAAQEGALQHQQQQAAQVGPCSSSLLPLLGKRKEESTPFCV